MKARQLISQAPFPPDALKIVAKAFEDAWAEIEPSVTDSFNSVEAAKLSLLNIVVSLAKDDADDAGGPHERGGAHLPTKASVCELKADGTRGGIT